MRILFGCASVAIAALCGTAQGIVFSGSSGTRSASVEFTVTGTNLNVRLTNTSMNDVMVPIDVLGSVFFEINGPALALTRISATLAPGSFVTNGAPPPGGDVGGEWAYNYSGAGFPGGYNYGISSTGLGSFGPGDRFPGANLAGPTNPDGLQYGIASLGDNPLTHNGGADVELIQHSVDFVFAGLPQGFDVNQITAVRFQYGTDYSEPNFDVPAPGAAVLVLAGAGLIGARRRRV